MKRIRKAVIPAAGLGTRFLPATKAIPKEMLPIVDIPTIQYIIKEAVESGIEEILVITNSNKHCMENHFDRSFELEERLKSANKLEEYQMICDIAEMANIYYVRQKEPRGLGHAVLCAKTFIGEEPFAVLLGDDVVIQGEHLPAIRQLMNAYERVETTIVGVQPVPHDQVGRYGIVKPMGAVKEPCFALTDFVEKPRIQDAPSDYAALGRYILTPDIFDHLEKQNPGTNGEIQLTDAIRCVLQEKGVYAYDFLGCRYDVGEKIGFIKATIDEALSREDLKEDLMAYIREIAQK